MTSIATNTVVDQAAMREFVRSRHRGVLLTTRADGSPQMSPMTVGMDDDGRIVMSSYPERAKSVNLRRNPHASVMVMGDEFNGAWMQVNGTAEVVDSPESIEGLVDYYRAISGEHPDWDEYRQAMRRQDKVLIRITPTSWGPVATGGFPARLVDGS